MYKFIAVDLDGTLLNSYGEVTENTKKVLKEKITSGIEFVIVSGRNMDSIKNISEEIGAKNYFIAGNGAIIYDIQKGKIIYNKYIAKSKALNIIKICEENSINYSVYTNKEIVANALKYNVLYYYKENMNKEDSKKVSIKIVQDIYEYIRETEDEVIKIFICDEHDTVFKSILKKINDIKDVEILDISHMSRKIIQNGSEEVSIEYFYTEISEKDVDKWNAIEFLIDRLNIKKEEVVAIGDNVNDINMIKNAGLGIAMKGSYPKVIDVADEITDETNDEEGAIKIVTKILQQY